MELSDLERMTRQVKERIKERYALAKRLGFSGSEAAVLQNRKREVIIDLAIKRGLIPDTKDPKAQ